MMSPATKIERHDFEFPADTAVLSEIGEIVKKYCIHASISDDDQSCVILAVDEACTNAIKHGLRSNKDKTFHLLIESKPGKILIEIRESGKPFNPTNISNPDLNAGLEERPIGGLGVFLIYELMDRVEYSLTEDGVKVLKMLKGKID
ncbi:ATP-binding protein [bacterium]|nr:ATP-binding protein [bacterium]